MMVQTTKVCTVGKTSEGRVAVMMEPAFAIRVADALEMGWDIHDSECELATEIAQEIERVAEELGG